MATWSSSQKRSESSSAVWLLSCINPDASFSMATRVMSFLRPDFSLTRQLYKLLHEVSPSDPSLDMLLQLFTGNRIPQSFHVLFMGTLPISICPTASLRPRQSYPPSLRSFHSSVNHVPSKRRELETRSLDKEEIWMSPSSKFKSHQGIQSLFCFCEFPAQQFLSCPVP